jgi:hypothetical protein
MLVVLIWESHHITSDQVNISLWLMFWRMNEYRQWRSISNKIYHSNISHFFTFHVLYIVQFRCGNDQNLFKSNDSTLPQNWEDISSLTIHGLDWFSNIESRSTPFNYRKTSSFLSSFLLPRPDVHFLLNFLIDSWLNLPDNDHAAKNPVQR